MGLEQGGVEGENREVGFELSIGLTEGEDRDWGEWVGEAGFWWQI